MPPRFATSIETSGPFFKQDPTKRLQTNIETMLQAFAKEGEADIEAQARPFSASGAFADGVVGRAQSLSGKHWRSTAVISQTHVYDWPKGGTKQYRGGKHEARHGFFKRTKGRLNRSRAVNRAELTKGMN